MDRAAAIHIILIVQIGLGQVESYFEAAPLPRVYDCFRFERRTVESLDP